MLIGAALKLVALTENYGNEIINNSLWPTEDTKHPKVDKLEEIWEFVTFNEMKGAKKGEGSLSVRSPASSKQGFNSQLCVHPRWCRYFLLHKRTFTRLHSSLLAPAWSHSACHKAAGCLLLLGQVMAGSAG